jgi:predicted N-formylglutamate amidohydrolase
MSPETVEEHVAQDRQILALARGFDALLEITQKLTCQERLLQSRLRFAHEEVC